MNSRTKRRSGVVTGLIVIVVVLTLAIVGGSSAAHAVSVAEALELSGDAKIQVTGNVAENSFDLDGGTLTFRIFDLFAALESVAAAKTFALDWLVGLLPVLVVYGFVRGCAFCGWTCPVNLFCEVVDWLRRKLHIEVSERVLPRHLSARRLLRGRGQGGPRERDDRPRQVHRLRRLQARVSMRPRDPRRCGSWRRHARPSRRLHGLWTLHRSLPHPCPHRAS